MTVRLAAQGLQSAHERAMAGSIPRQARDVVLGEPYGGSDQSDVSERFS